MTSLFLYVQKNKIV
ncbi:hypothetical protein ACQJBY_059500 [Aegilops geniculata]